MSTYIYSRGCLQGYCVWASTAHNMWWPNLCHAWHWLWCKWARWPEGKKLPESMWRRVQREAKERRKSKWN